MHKLVEEHLTRAITDRFNAGLKEPERCGKARQKVIDESLALYRQNAGYGGVSRETLAWALESMAVELETVRAGGKETSDRLVRAQLEIRDIKAGSHTEHTAANDILLCICGLIFDDPDHILKHGHEGIVEEIVDIKNRLSLYRSQVGKFCNNRCSGNGLGPCYLCQLGKL